MLGASTSVHSGKLNIPNRQVHRCREQHAVGCLVLGLVLVGGLEQASEQALGLVWTSVLVQVMALASVQECNCCTWQGMRHAVDP